MTELTRVRWWRRAIAFAIDYALFVILWDAIDNLVSFPVPEGLMSIGSAAFFCLYFAVTEGMGKVKASPGKRATGLVVVLRDGGQTSSIGIGARSAILATFVACNWTSVLSLHIFAGLPAVVLIWSRMIPVALVLYNGLLAVRGPEGLMLQDGLTCTTVVSSAAPATAPVATLPTRLGKNRSEWPRWDICVLLIVIALFVSVFLRSIFPEALEINREVEEAITQGLEVRNRVEIASTYAKELGAARTKRTLEISVWLPFISWNETTVRKAADLAAAKVRVQPGYYDSASVSVSTGGGIFRVNRTFELNLPKPEEK